MSDYEQAPAPIEDKSTSALPGIMTGIGTILGGPLGGLAGSVLSGIFSAKSAKSQQKFQEYMSSTAHQREVADLRAAGLNPILSATGGKGASTPAGTSVNYSNPTEAVNSARVVNAQLENIKADTMLKATTAQKESAIATNQEVQTAQLKWTANDLQSKIASEAKTAGEQYLQSQHQTENLKWIAIAAKENAQLSRYQQLIAGEQLKSALNEGKISETQFGQFMAYINRMTSVIPFVNSAKSLGR